LNGLVSDIRRKQAAGYTFRDIVVLCRTRAQARKITQALVAANLPVIERGGMLEQEHIRNLLSLVILVAEPSGMGILRAARQSGHPLAQGDIEALLLAAREQKSAPVMLILRNEAPLEMSIEGCRSLSALSTILKALRLAPDVWTLLADYLLIETSLVRELLESAGDPQARAMLTDYAGILQLARSYDRQQQALRIEEAPVRGEDVPIREQARGFLDYLSVLLTLHHDGGNRRENAANNGEEAPDAIRVMTVHASKGLEFPVVYLPGLVNGRFPTHRRSSPVEAPKGMLAAEGEMDAIHETGEACLFYVGATRARDELVLSYAERYGRKNYKRSAYIDALVAGLPDERATRVAWQDQQGIVPQEEDPLSSQPSEGYIEAVRPKTLTISALETYQRCPRQYMYGTIYGFRGEEATYRLFWNATQDTLEALKNQLEANQEGFPTQEEARQLYTHYWQEWGGHTFPFAALYERHGHEVTELVRRRLLERGDTSWQLRQNFTVDIAGRTIELAVDRVEAPAQAGEPVRLVRTRFGKRKEKPTASTRELLYARASRQHHPGRNFELLVHNMSTGETLQVKLTEKREQSLYNELEQAILGLERNEFPPKPDPFLCPNCPFFLICPA
jgi:DNA helicase-2/ATP-dependent DNA helicase PcrA